MGKYLPSRQCPRLWVETLWLLESRGAGAAYSNHRTSPGPERGLGARAGGGRFFRFRQLYSTASAEITFRLPPRHRLGDDAPSINTMCDKTSAGFPKGAWPPKFISMTRRGWCSDLMVVEDNLLVVAARELDALLSGALPGGFQEFMEQLEGAVGRLTAKTPPATSCWNGVICCLVYPRPETR